MTQAVSGLELARIGELGTAALWLSIRPVPHSIILDGFSFRFIPFAAGVVLVYRPTKDSPASIPGRLPNVVKVYRRKQVVLDVHFSDLPELHIKVEHFARGDWEDVLLDEKRRFADPAATGRSLH